MKDHSIRQEKLAELRLQFNFPLRVETLIKAYGDKLSNIDISVSIEDVLRNFLFEIIDKFLSCLHIDDILEETNSLSNSVRGLRKEKYVEFKIFENGNFEEANKLLIDLYAKWNSLQLNKEWCSDHIILVRKAITYLTSLKKVISVFIMDEKSHNFKFKNASESKRLVEYFVVDIESYIDLLKDQITELSAQIDLISSKINMLMRADSSLRLLSKYAEWDKDYNSGSRKTSSSNREEDFSIEET